MLGRGGQVTAQNQYSLVAGKVVVTDNLFGQIASQAGNDVAGKMRAGMMNYLIIADRLTPVDKGLLKANKTIVVPTKAFGSNPKGKITWNQEYGIYQNFGTVYIPGVHFAEKAAALIMPSYTASFNGVFGGGSVR